MKIDPKEEIISSTETGVETKSRNIEPSPLVPSQGSTPVLSDVFDVLMDKIENVQELTKWSEKAKRWSLVIVIGMPFY